MMADRESSTTPDRQATSVSELLDDAQQLWSDRPPKPSTSPSTPPDSVVLMSESGLPASDEESTSVNSRERNAANRVQDLFQQFKNASAADQAMLLLSLSSQMPDSQSQSALGESDSWSDHGVDRGRRFSVDHARAVWL